MSSKDEILKAIRTRKAPDAAIPDLRGEWIQYADRFAQFQSVVESVGGRCERVVTAAEIPAKLAGNPQFATAARVISGVSAVPSTFDAATITDPHGLETIDWAILPGEFGVAESGAVWVTDEHVKLRALYFIVQHLALVLPADQIVHNLHEAYDRLTLGTSSLGVFISGPSKTADIEQLLVIGAHGPRSLTVFCVDRST